MTPVSRTARRRRGRTWCSRDRERARPAECARPARRPPPSQAAPVPLQPLSARPLDGPPATHAAGPDPRLGAEHAVGSALVARAAALDVHHRDAAQLDSAGHRADRPADLALRMALADEAPEPGTLSAAAAHGDDRDKGAERAVGGGAQDARGDARSGLSVPLRRLARG